MKVAVSACCLAILLACGGRSSSVIEVSGTLSHLDSFARANPAAVKNGTVVVLLYEVPFGSEGQPIQLDADTLKVDETAYSLKGITASNGMFDIVIDGGPMVPIVHDASPITVDIDCTARDHFYRLKGSSASEKLRSFIEDYSARSLVVNRALDSIDNLKKLNAPDSLLILATNFKNTSIENFNEFLISFLSTADNPTVASFALGRAAQTLPQPTFEKGLGELVKRFPEDATIKAISEQYESYKAAAQESSRRREQSTWVGKKAPDLTLPDTNGQATSISSFTGKYVLVDFWASWCRPCRAENPNVVAAYNKYRNRNFTVLGVSLDKTKEAWINAIREDGLRWSHISDLAFWNSQAVAIYKFDGIPYNILIDPGGTVIAEGLRGEQLPNKLNEVLK